MYYHKTGYPEEDELVMCTVTNVQYNSVFVKLDDYPNKSALIHISEVSPGRIRNLRDFVKEGKVIVCKILRIHEERGHIDASLRRVNEAQRRMKVEERKAEQKAEKIIDALAKDLKEEPKKVYAAIAKVLLPEYEMLNYAFDDVVENNASLEKLGLDKKYAVPLQALVIERIKPKEVAIEGDLNVTSYDIDGLEIIKKSLAAFESSHTNLTTRYLGGGTWRVTITAPEFKEAEAILKEAIQKSKPLADEKGATFTFKRKE